MLGKNNYAELVKKYADSKQRFAIRRIGLVTVSVLLGDIWLLQTNLGVLLHSRQRLLVLMERQRRTKDW